MKIQIAKEIQSEREREEREKNERGEDGERTGKRKKGRGIEERVRKRGTTGISRERERHTHTHTQTDRQAGEGGERIANGMAEKVFYSGIQPKDGI